MVKARRKNCAETYENPERNTNIFSLFSHSPSPPSPPHIHVPRFHPVLPQWLYFHSPEVSLINYYWFNTLRKFCNLDS